jgi:hypothetical protein
MYSHMSLETLTSICSFFFKVQIQIQTYHNFIFQECLIHYLVSLAFSQNQVLLDHYLI